MWTGYKNFDHFFEASQLVDFFKEVSETELSEVRGGRNYTYINCPCAFDIEVSSFLDKDGEKMACMYLWGLNLNGSSIYGRTWDEFFHVLNEIVEFLGISLSRRLIIYVHNLGYEFQFLRKRILWAKEKGKDKIFAIKERRPVYALAESGIEFRCSYFLSNYSLAYIGDNLLVNYPVKKAVGDLDYYKVRHSETPLTQKEILYQIQDVQVVASYIQEKIEQDGSIAEIPLTNTGYVRNYCRNQCFGAGLSPEIQKKKLNNYRELMKCLSITSEQEYDQLKKAFGGGFTHASAMHSGNVMLNVGSADRTSAYPYEMLAKTFPMSRGVYLGKVTSQQADFFCSHYCCLFTVVIKGLSATFEYDNYISVSKCSSLSTDYIANNGRVVEADFLQITITEQDWEIIKLTYEWDSVEFISFRIYERGYLPRDFILAVLELYSNKTTLKGIDEKQVEYMVSKNMLNSSFGMAVTSIVRDEFYYSENDWHKDEADVASQLVSYNKGFNRFLFYAWGVWVTAYARNSLWHAILEFGDDYIYADTDSIKGKNFSKHETWFKIANLNCKLAIKKMCDYYNIPIEKARPVTSKGVPKDLGVWEIEKPYAKFKTIGAKRYLYEYEDGELLMTVSGLNKYEVIPYLLNKKTAYQSKEDYEFFKLAYSQNSRLAEKSKAAMNKLKQLRLDKSISYDAIFNDFKDGLYIPAGYTGKLTMTYIDKPKAAICKDYLGNEKVVYEYSSVHASPQDYMMNQNEDYIRFINGIQDASL